MDVEFEYNFEFFCMEQLADAAWLSQEYSDQVEVIPMDEDNLPF